MNNLKDKMYNYEVAPPEDVWSSITSELNKNDGENIIQLPGKNRRFYYSLAAASVTIIVFSLIFFKMYSSKTGSERALSQSNSNMRVPDEDVNNRNKKATDIAQAELQQNDSSGKKSSGKTLEIQTNEAHKNTIVATSNPKSYITIAGPEGQAVKVSSKVAALIESSDDSYPPRPVWNKKISKWKNIMLAKTLAPTPGNFLDIVELNNAVADETAN